ncbi:phage tail tape measure protein [Paenibacillus alvei]|nr:phage tail tape measure protein [Paenibacillus alvei]NEZ43728.1 phage tail tape measure protein [Paenibacillus alvei]
MGKQYQVDFRLGAALDSSFSRSLTAASSDFKNLQRDVMKLGSSKGSANTTSPIREDLKRTQKELRKTGKESDYMSNQIKKAGATVAGFLGARAAIGFGKDIVNTFAGFEQGMANVRAVSGLDKTSEDFQKLTAKAREMGERTSKTASEAADGLQYLALAGWNTQQMLAGIEPVLRLSEAGAMDLGRASDLATDSMAALGLGVKELPAYLDKVAQASRRSNTSVEQLMDAFLVSGGSFKTFNVPLEEATSLLGILANRGYKGSEAGTAMNAIITNLTSGMGQAGTAMEELKLSAFDSKGKFKGLENVFLEVKEKIDKMTDSQKAQYIAMIAGKEHLKTFTGILDGLGKEYGALKKDVSHANGALMEMSTTQMDTFQGSMKLLESAVESAKIQLGEKFAPTIRKVADDISTKLPEAMQELEKNWPLVIDRAQTAGKVLGGLVGTIAMFKTVNGVKNTFTTVSTGMSNVARGARMIAPAIGMLANPIGIAVAAVGALAGGWYLYRRHQEKARQELIHMGDTLKTSLSDYSAVETQTEKTKVLVNEYDRLQAKIADSKTPADELTEAKRKLVDVETQLKDLYPEIISQHDIENGKLEQKIGLIDRLSKAQLEEAKLKLEKDIADNYGNVGKLQQEISELSENKISLELDKEKYYEAYVSIKELENEFKKIVEMDYSDQRTNMLESLREKANEIGKDVGLNFSIVGNILGASDSLHDKYKETLDKLVTTSDELKTAESSYQQLYDAQRQLIELNLGAKLEEQSKKFNQLSDEEKKRFNEALNAVAQLNNEMKNLDTEKEVKIKVLMEQSGQQFWDMNNLTERITSGVPSPTKKYAEGGFITRPHLGLVGEAGPEAIIPLSSSRRGRALGLYESVGKALGVRPYANGGIVGSLSRVNSVASNSSQPGINIDFSPSIVIQGDADPGVLKYVDQAMLKLKEDFGRMLENHLRQKSRVSMNGAT